MYIYIYRYIYTYIYTYIPKGAKSPQVLKYRERVLAKIALRGSIWGTNLERAERCPKNDNKLRRDVISTWS